MKKYAMALNYKDFNVIRHGWVKVLAETPEKAQETLLKAAMSVKGFIVADKMIEVETSSVESCYYLPDRVRFDLSIGGQSSESYYRDIADL